jgi:hypothetical protein
MKALAGSDEGGWTLLPVRVDDVQPTGLLAGFAYLDLCGLGEEEASRQLVTAAGQALGRPEKPQAAPSFPAGPHEPAVRGPAVHEPPRFPALLPSFVSLSFDIRVGDILDFPADIAVFKHADGFHGADRAAARRLHDVGRSHEELAASLDDVRLVQTRGALAAPLAMFIGVGAPSQLSYAGLRAYSSLMVRAVSSRGDARHVATTIHGPGFGLDERAAFLSQLAGILTGIGQLQGQGDLERITVVERNSDRAEELGRALEDSLEEIPYAWLVERSEGLWRFGISAQTQPIDHFAPNVQPAPIKLLEREPDREPHMFIAYPFELEDHARFGLERPAAGRGFLTRLIAEQAYTGDILERVKSQIESAVLVVAVLTQANPNVFLEVGYAWGRGRPTVLVAQADEKLRFDVQGQRILRYSNITDLERQFIDEITELRRTAVI